MEKLILNALEIERINSKTDDGLIPVEGYACHFGVANHNGEIVDEASFKNFFKEMEKGGMMPVFNYQHSDQIIGGWDKFVADSVGLKAYGHLNANVVEVRDNILPLVQAGDVAYLSTEGWCDWDSVNEQGDNYYLANFKLLGVSLVSMPADFGAAIKIKNELELRRKKVAEPKYRKLFY